MLEEVDRDDSRKPIVEWRVDHLVERDDQVIVRRAGRYTSQELHRTVFPKGVPDERPADVKDAIRRYIRKKHARR